MWKWRPKLVCTGIGVASGLRKRSTSAPTAVPKSEGRLCWRSAAPDKPSCSSALRLAPTMRPSGATARMPSISVSMNSGRLWKCSRMALRWSSLSQWFSIMRADIFTSAMVCWW